MFIASVSAVNGPQFTSDKNGNLPVALNCRAGKMPVTKGNLGLLNGTVANNSGVKTGKIYLFDSKVIARQDDPSLNQIVYEVVAEISALDLINSVGTMGTGTTFTPKELEVEAGSFAKIGQKED